MQIALKESQLGLRNSTTRLPFRYGNVCLSSCPQAVLQVTLEVDGQLAHGYSGDCLPPGWFDKSPEKNYAQQIDDMLEISDYAQQVFLEEFTHPTQFFPAWLAASGRIHEWAHGQNFTPLLASFGASLIERAMIDAMARAARPSFHQLVHENLLGIEPGQVHRQLGSHSINQWLPSEPTTSIFVRHTVGLADPLTAADIPVEERLDDGFPQSLEEYLAQSSICYLKVKVSNQLDNDIGRLLTIAALVEKHRGNHYSITLDGNEQYHQAGEFDHLIESIRSQSELATLLANTLVIEQPLARNIALDEKQTAGVRQLAKTIPVIIDESDGTLNSYPEAIDLGYRGVSSKNCKGTIKSLLNCGLTWLHNDQGQRTDYVMTGEDLCSVGVIPVQADLCLAATLGLTHIERNGHHYHPGLNYLSPAEQQDALAAHGDFYAFQHDRVVPQVIDGQFYIGSLPCHGFGFAALPDMKSLQSPDQWQYKSLGLG